MLVITKDNIRIEASGPGLRWRRHCKWLIVKEAWQRSLPLVRTTGQPLVQGLCTISGEAISHGGAKNRSTLPFEINLFHWHLAENQWRLRSPYELNDSITLNLQNITPSGGTEILLVPTASRAIGSGVDVRNIVPRLFVRRAWIYVLKGMKILKELMEESTEVFPDLPISIGTDEAIPEPRLRARWWPLSRAG